MVRHTRFRSGQQPSEEWFAAASLGDTAAAYVQYLTERGYAAGSIKGYFGSVAHFVHWLTQRRFRAGDICESLIDRFLDRHLPGCRCAPQCWRARSEVRAALRQFLKMLRLTGVCARKLSVIPAAIAAELEDFDRHLVDVRGLAASTRAIRMRHLLDFLTDRFGAGAVTVSALAPADVADFMTRYTAGRAPGSVKATGISLRSYFMLKASRREPTKALIAALPRVALGLLGCRNIFRQPRSSGFSVPSIAPARPANGTSRLRAVCSIWGCGVRKWPTCGWTMWIGERGLCTSKPRVSASTYCLCPKPRAMPSRTTCGPDGHKQVGASCSCAIARPPMRRPTWISFAMRCATPPNDVDSNTVFAAPTFSDTPWLLVWCKAVRRSRRLPTCCAIAASIPQRSTRRSICQPSRASPRRGPGGRYEQPRHTHCVD